jgi:ribonucleoside-diphosphate reductase subunit M1
MKNADQLDSAIVHSRDHNFDYFGYKVLERSYLLKLNGKVAERPQYMYLRTALQVWGSNIEKVVETYNLLSEGYYTHATPTLFNSGTGRPQLSSCFLLDVQDDSIEGFFNTLIESAQISKNAGGIGISFNKVRAKGTYIAGTNNFIGTVTTTSGMTGKINGKFYGPGVNEIGGTYAVYGAGIGTLVGSFGGKR